MLDKFSRSIRSMELEEQILHGSVALCALSVLFPWFSDQQAGEATMATGFGYYTGYIGFAVFLLQLFILCVTILPQLGGPVLVRKAVRNYVRLLLSSLSLILLIAALSVLVSVTVEFSRAEIRFGIYAAIIFSGIATLYCWLLYQQESRSRVLELFHHPDEHPARFVPAQEPETTIPPPSPPPPPPLEDHHLFT